MENIITRKKENIFRTCLNFCFGKYVWSFREFWLTWLKQDIKRLYYSKIFGFNMSGIGGTLIPQTRKGKYVSVYTKGQIIQIKHESGYNDLEYDEFRIIPYEPNHGVMIEKFKNGKMCGRDLLDICQLNKCIIFASNVEQLASKK